MGEWGGRVVLMVLGWIGWCEDMQEVKLGWILLKGSGLTQIAYYDDEN